MNYKELGIKLAFGVTVTVLSYAVIKGIEYCIPAKKVKSDKD